MGFVQLAGFGIAASALGYWQVLRSPEMVARADNNRRLDELLRTERGAIFDRKGRPIARSERGSGGYVRRLYPQPTLAPVTGVFNPVHGSTGIEAAYDDHLAGRVGLDPGESFERRLLHRPTVGSDLVLTIDLDVQEAAERALAQRPVTPGAVVAIDPRTGAIRAFATTPSFDPTRLTFDPTAEDWQREGEQILTYARQLEADPGGPLLNRATQGLYPPGSTFKTITLAAALERGAIKPNDRLSYQLKPADRNHRVAWHDNQFVQCQNHGQTGQFDLAHAYAYSCNITFSDLGSKIGAPAYLESARRFGLDQQPSLPVPVEASRLNQRPDFFTGDERFYAVASTAMGQGELLVTPLQMALVAAAMAGNGSVPAPYLVEEIRRPGGGVVDRHRTDRWQPGVSAVTAAIVRDMMVVGVDDGWASGAKIAGAKIGGKTGTAELGGDRVEPHAWFIGFATADNPRLAVALIKEQSGASSAVAAPAAKIVLEAGLKFA